MARLRRERGKRTFASTGGAAAHVEEDVSLPGLEARAEWSVCAGSGAN